MSLVQAILIAIIAGVSRCEGDWLGECKLREPIVTGFLVGLVLGDVKTGLIIGAELQLMWMGAVGIGPVAQLDIGIGGTIGTAVAIATGTGAETAILFGVPVAVIMQFLNTLLMSAYSGVMLSADKKIDALDFRGIRWCHYFCGICTFLAYTIPTFIVMFFGNELIEGIVNNMPDWINTGLGGVAALLPCLGFALLLNIIMEKRLIPYFILGFIPAAYVGFDLTMVAIAAIAVAVAWIIFMLRSNEGTSKVAANTAADDEWED